MSGQSGASGPKSGSEIVETALELLAVLRENQRAVLRGLGIGCLVGLAYGFGSTQEFDASAKIVPYRNAQGSSGLSGLAGLAGIRLPAGMGEPTVTADLMPEIAKTIDFRTEVASRELALAKGRRASFAVYFDSIYEPSLVEYLRRFTIGLPGISVAWLRARLTSGDAGDSTISSGIPTLSVEEAERLARLSERLRVSIDKRNGILTVSARMPEPVAAAALVNEATSVLTEVAIRIESNKASDQLRFAEEQLAAARLRFSAAQREYATYQSRNRGVLDPLLRIEDVRLQAEQTLAASVVEQLAREVEQARLRRAQDTPVFTVIQTPHVPARRSAPNRVAALLICALAGAMVGLGVARLRQYNNSRVGV